MNSSRSIIIVIRPARISCAYGTCRPKHGETSKRTEISFGQYQLKGPVERAKSRWGNGNKTVNVAYVEYNTDGHSYLCTLHSSPMALQFSPLQSHFLLSCTVSTHIMEYCYYYSGHCAVTSSLCTRNDIVWGEETCSSTHF